MAKKKLLTVREYAATRKGWRNQPVGTSYIYNLIKLFEKGKKSAIDIGFVPHAEGKGYMIQPLKKKIEKT